MTPESLAIIAIVVSALSLFVYGGCLLVMLIVAIGQLLYFKKRRWL